MGGEGISSSTVGLVDTASVACISGGEENTARMKSKESLMKVMLLKQTVFQI